MRLILLSVLTYGCGDEAKFYSATGEVEKKAAKIKSESEFCPDTCGDISAPKWEDIDDKDGTLTELGEEFADMREKLQECINRPDKAGVSDAIMEGGNRMIDSRKERTNELAGARDVPLATCKYYYFEVCKVKQIKLYYERNCSRS